MIIIKGKQTSTGPSGPVDYLTYGGLPENPSDGDQALVNNTLYTARAGYWLPWYMPGTTVDNARSCFIEESLAQLVAKGSWIVSSGAEVSKSAGNPLTFNAGAGTGVIMYCVPPSNPCSIILKGVTKNGVGRLWGYFGNGTKLTEFLGPNNTLNSFNFRNPSNGVLYGRELAFADGAYAALGFRSTPEQGVTLWTSEADNKPFGNSLSASLMYTSGVNAWRFLQGNGGGHQTTINEIIVLTE